MYIIKPGWIVDVAGRNSLDVKTEYCRGGKGSSCLLVTSVLSYKKLRIKIEHYFYELLHHTSDDLGGTECANPHTKAEY